MYNNNELKHYGVLGMKWGQYRKAKLQKKIDKNSRKQKNELNKIDKDAKKHRSIVESRYDEKITKAREKTNKDRASRLESEKKERLTNYDAKVKNLKNAIKAYNNIANNMAKLKIKTIDDPTIRNSKSYRKAQKLAQKQTLLTAAVGKQRVLLDYTQRYDWVDSVRDKR